MSRHEQTGGFHPRREGRGSRGRKETKPSGGKNAIGEETLFATPIHESIIPREQFIPREVPQHYSSNSTLTDVCDIISATPPNWDYLLDKLEELPKTSTDKNRHGPLAELYVIDIINRTATLDGFSKICAIDPLENKEGGGFRFRRKPDLKLYATDHKGNSIAEYDKVGEIGTTRLPTVFEVKALSEPSYMNLVNFLEPAHTQRFLSPIKGYYGTNKLGLVVVANPELVQYKSHALDAFIENGGRIIPMNTSLEELKHQASRVRSTPKIVFSSYSLPYTLPSYRPTK